MRYGPRHLFLGIGHVQQPLQVRNSSSEPCWRLDYLTPFAISIVHRYHSALLESLWSTTPYISWYGLGICVEVQESDSSRPASPVQVAATVRRFCDKKCELYRTGRVCNEIFDVHNPRFVIPGCNNSVTVNAIASGRYRDSEIPSECGMLLLTTLCRAHLTQRI